MTGASLMQCGETPAVESTAALASCLQIVDDDGEFAEDINARIDAEWGLTDCSTDYHIVTVLGPPGSGKSTLLNAVFGTQFSALSNSGLLQTTEGFWMGRALGMNVLAIDAKVMVDIPDSDDTAYYFAGITFAVTASSALIVNLRENMIGESRIMGLLKAIFKMHLGLLGTRQKTRLLFAIRDCSSSTSLERLTSLLIVDMECIWDELPKPHGLEDCTVGDIFDCDFLPLPSKIRASDEFDAAAVQLRERFTDQHNESYMLKQCCRKPVAADGIGSHLQSLWSDADRDWYAILDDQKPGEDGTAESTEDPPSAAELHMDDDAYEDLVQSLYDMADSQAQKEFIEGAMLLQQAIDAGTMDAEAFSENMGHAYSNALATFDAIAEQYQHKSREIRRNALKSKCYETAESIFPGQTQWNMSMLGTQLYTKWARQQQEKAVQACAQQESEQHTARLELAICTQRMDMIEQKTVIDEHEARIREREAAAHTQDAKIAALQAVISMQDNEIKTLEALVSAQDRDISAQQTTNRQQEALISEQKRIIAELRAQIGELKLENVRPDEQAV
ncbi:root hair defective 3 GTP-binding protein-domain-containing protein [Thamnocephalis sphaerospora]|uniref:Root hair defective 3 GTP-binding protein-domain-containing protein n=1 Tax=Thamnocephalis sphaerospora TaxID=78915 RepID=A0A4P9XI80_9FUNG|nr:root hair defective 3 GTP-binding protein-domain-containing protein [Thamnocephalis sphaerospora]|eukprot:RKP04980.1 root hair defective 3 GTP-binding protein-domain-containing protein [Thamnocephalis sphaerospora]